MAMNTDRPLMRTLVRRAILASQLVLVTTLAACGGWLNSSGEPDAVGGPPVMRRLTESEYRATVADIFGEDIPIPARFEPGLRSEGLVAIGTGLSGMSPFSIEQYDAAAQGVAAAVTGEQHRDQLVPCKPKAMAAFDDGCATTFIKHYGLLLFRRPLTAEQTQRYVEAARTGTTRLGNFYSGLEFALAGMMMAPDFLLRVDQTVPAPHKNGLQELDAYSKATQLSYFLVGSTPDAELLRAAAAGELDSRGGLARQVDRLIASPHFERGVRAFFYDMLQFDQFSDLSKDPQIYPAYNSTVAADAQEQTLRTLTQLLVKQDGDYRDVFTTRDAWLTRALGVVYRVPVATRNGWEESEFPLDSHRQGIQSQVAFLALHSHPGRSSATLRGKALRQIFFCQDVPDPPANVNFALLDNADNAKMPTARDRLTAHRNNPSCAGCHKIMDPAGLTLENYDGVGGWRTTENGAAIDASGNLDWLEFKDPAGLAQALHDHPEPPRCLVERMYRYSVGRDTEMSERPYMDYLIETFKSDGYRVPQLMRTIALSRNFFAISDRENDSLDF